MNHPSSPNLVRITEYEGEDITKLKIYHDTEVGQYKVRHRCHRCKLDMGCYCYDFIEDAVVACTEVNWTCKKHVLDSVWVDYDMAASIDEVCGTNLTPLVDENDYVDREKEIIEVFKSITEEQASKILSEYDLSDEYYQGWCGSRCSV